MVGATHPKRIIFLLRNRADWVCIMRQNMLLTPTPHSPETTRVVWQPPHLAQRY
jgi:hypothetical protein